MSLKKIRLAVIMLSALSCNSDQLVTTKTGLQYKVYKDEPGVTAKTGDTLILHLIYTTQQDSVIVNTHHTRPIDIVLNDPGNQQGLMEGLHLLSKGDSALFIISSDSLRQDWRNFLDTSIYRKSSHLKYAVKVLEIKRVL